MSINGTVEAPSEAASALAPDTTLKEILTPLLAHRDQLLSEESELEAKLSETVASIKAEIADKSTERKRVERVLRSGEMIAPAPKSESKASKEVSQAKLIAPTTDKPRTQHAAQIQIKAIEAIESMEGEPFQVGMIEKRIKMDRRTIERAIGVMRGEDRIRLLGKRPQLERPTPGGKKALTFQEIR